MNISSLARYAIGVSAAAALLAGCNGGSQSSGFAAPGAPAQSVAGSGHKVQFPSAKMIALTNYAHVVPTIHRIHRKSWIKRDAGRQFLAYSSDTAIGTVDIYNYRVKAGKLFGQITGFSFPYGQCLDSSGNVYVVDYGSANIYEFAHGGITPIATAADSYGYPIGCSVDSVGDVAVSNFYGFSGPGGVVVFSGGLSGSQTFYTEYNSSTGAGLYYYWPPGYDPSANITVEGEDLGTNYGIAQLSGGIFTDLTGLGIYFPGAVQWDGTYLSATDQAYGGKKQTGQQQITISGSAITVVRTSILTDNCDGPFSNNDLVQPALNGTVGHRMNAVYGGNIWCTSRNAFWNYTNGGNPKRFIPPAIVPGTSYGQVVSPPTGS